MGITVITDLVPRAYQIADTYRRKGVKVVMGGIHPTICLTKRWDMPTR